MNNGTTDEDAFRCRRRSFTVPSPQYLLQEAVVDARIAIFGLNYIWSPVDLADF